MFSLGLAAASFLIVLPLQAAEYEVKKGDSLWKIANNHDTSIIDLKELNNLDSDIIFPKQRLKIDKETTYIVQQGDTLSEIAREFNVTVNDIIEWNDLSSDLIIIGQELVIKENTKASEQEKEAAAPVKKQNTAKKASVDKTTKAEKQNNSKQASSEQDGETISVTATAYTAGCDGCSGITATGINLNDNPNKKVIAVDPDVIPLGSRVHVEGYGEAIAGDTGGAINGNKIDIHVPTKDEAYSWGVRTVDVTILN